jgi:hypothetical protein
MLFSNKKTLSGLSDCVSCHVGSHALLKISHPALSSASEPFRGAGHCGFHLSVSDEDQAMLRDHMPSAFEVPGEEVL